MLEGAKQPCHDNQTDWHAKCPKNDRHIEAPFRLSVAGITVTEPYRSNHKSVRNKELCLERGAFVAMRRRLSLRAPPWTEAEREDMRDSVKRGVSVLRAAAAFGRTRTGVRNQARKIRLPIPTKRDARKKFTDHPQPCGVLIKPLSRIIPAPSPLRPGAELGLRQRRAAERARCLQGQQVHCPSCIYKSLPVPLVPSVP